MENFAAVIRTLLARIRTAEAAKSRRNPPPTAPAVIDSKAHSRYRAATTTWGVVDAEVESTTADSPIEPESKPSIAGSLPPASETYSASRRTHRSIELTVYPMPVPRGLPST